MLKKKKKFRGYLFVEGLLALFIMTVAITILIPHLIQFKKNAQMLEEKVICTRLFYEETQNKVEKRSQSISRTRDGIFYEVFLNERGIRIKRGGVEVGFQEN